MDRFCYFMPTEVHFAEGGLATLGDVCNRLGSKPFVVTGRRSARESGILDRVIHMLPTAVVFDRIDPNPTDRQCDEAAVACRRAGCDCVVALGGGSPIDAAKVVALLATNPGRCGDYFGADRYSESPLPILAVPTTAGTGSEVTPYAVITDSELRTKRTISGKALFPKIAILDPELTLTLPPDITADTGLDVLSQAMEGIASKKATPWTDALALEVCDLVRKWLPDAVYDGSNLEARGRLLYAACLSGCVIAHTGTTLVHGMGYTYTLECGIPHGRANALLLAPIFAFNARYIPERVCAISAVLGHPCASGGVDSCSTIAQAIYSILRSVGVPAAAKVLGVSRENLAHWAAEIARDPYRYRNQVGDITEQAILKLYEQSYEGNVL